MYEFLFDFNRNYASILYRFQVITHFSSKVVIYPTPLAFVVSIGGYPVWISLWSLKSEN